MDDSIREKRSRQFVAYTKNEFRSSIWGGEWYARHSREVSLITGAARGIGQVIALHLAREGSDVLVSDLDEDGAERMAAEIPGIRREV